MYASIRDQIPLENSLLSVERERDRKPIREIIDSHLNISALFKKKF